MQWWEEEQLEACWPADRPWIFKVMLQRFLWTIEGKSMNEWIPQIAKSRMFRPICANMFNSKIYRLSTASIITHLSQVVVIKRHLRFWVDILQEPSETLAFQVFPESPSLTDISVVNTPCTCATQSHSINYLLDHDRYSLSHFFMPCGFVYLKEFQ